MTQVSRSWTDDARRVTIAGKGHDIPAIVAEPEGAPLGVVLVVHGRNGAPQQAQIAEIADAYVRQGWRVLAPALPHSIATPGSGPATAVTFSGHTAAAREVWDWVAQEWPDLPRGLAGHSIGAYAVAHLADAQTHHVLAVSPPLSGMVLLNARIDMGPAAIEAVKAEAPAFYAEMPVADAEPALRAMAAPLAVVTGASDGLVRLHDARRYFAAAPNGRFFGALPNEHHCPAGAACGQMLSAALLALGVQG